MQTLVDEESQVGESQTEEEISSQEKQEESSETEVKPEVRDDFWQNPEKLAKSYKALQGEYTKLTQQIARVGNLDSLMEKANKFDLLSENPDITKQLEKAREKAEYGHEFDEDTKAAIKFIEELVDKRVSASIEGVRSSVVQDKINKHFNRMDEEYGKEWRLYVPNMQHISRDELRRGEITYQALDDPTFETIETLFLRAAKNDLPKFFAKKDKEVIDKKMKMSTSKGSSSSNMTEDEKVVDIQSAYKLAKAQLAKK